MAINDFVGVLEDFVEEGISFGIEDILLLLTVLGAMLFMATNLRLGLIILFLLSAVEFVLFAMFGYETIKALYAVLVTLVAMALSIYFSAGKKIV